MNDNREPRPDPLDLLPRGPAAWILQADVDVGPFLPGWRQLFSFVDREPIEALEQAGYEQRSLVHGVVLADTLFLSFNRSLENKVGLVGTYVSRPRSERDEDGGVRGDFFL